MLKKKKWIFYLGHLLRMSTVNKVRLLLTFLGLTTAVFIFAAGSIITESVYQSSLAPVEVMKENTIVVSSENNITDVKDKIAKFLKNSPRDVVNVYEKIMIKSVEHERDKYIFVATDLWGVRDINGMAVASSNIVSCVPLETQIIRGRGITAEDLQTNARVLIIDELSEQILFPYENAIGKTVQFNVGIDGNLVSDDDGRSEEEKFPIFEIVGVIENSYFTNMELLRLKNIFSVKEQGNIRILITAYCPFTTVLEMYESDEYSRRLVYEFQNETAYKRGVSSLQFASDLNPDGKYTFVQSTKDSEMSFLKLRLESQKQMLNTITLLLCIISGISILSISLFTVKERIPEIGIRKAFGASRLDIAFQFIFEMFFVSLFVSAFAVVLSIVACKLAEGFLSERYLIAIKVSLNERNVILPLLVGVIVAVFCSVIPSLYASKIKVTDALRFE
ncbi:MAG: FtsX-like permease family protein [Oscillospiraceae bacterium]|jgi:ABC-type antimicrobial peptide transport system permease subunit|nr:FtsX-like permease family protein [Oscillospiraceae bacterium]